MARLILIFAVLMTAPAVAKDRTGDTHYTEAGFFDIHVCNWPDREPFYLAVFTSERFAEVENITITDHNGGLIGEIGLDKYQKIKRKNKPEKRAYITHIPIPKATEDGWYEADIAMKDGSTVVSKDLVVHGLLGRASGQDPAHGAELAEVPGRLSWEAIDGAGYYQVFIRDKWNDSKLIYSSKLIRTNHIDLPKDLLEAGGFYTWKVHARDVNEDVKLGDFNKGSQSEWVEFSID